MEIMPSPGESGNVPASACGLDVAANPFFSRPHFAPAQTVFLERIVGGVHFYRPQGDNFPVKHEADIIPLHSLLEPVAEPAPSFRDC